MADPVQQFEIKKLVHLGEIAGQPFAFTNSALFMFIAVATILLFLLASTAPRAILPGRWQSAVEMTYSFVAGTLRESTGHEGMKFFPLVFSLFLFVLFCT